MIILIDSELVLKIALPIPTGFDLNIATWNVAGLREISKYDQILTFSRSKNIHLLAVQETKSDSVSAAVPSRKMDGRSSIQVLPLLNIAGVGFFVSPSLRPHVKNFLAHTPRICELTFVLSPTLWPSFQYMLQAKLRTPTKTDLLVSTG